MVDGIVPNNNKQSEYFNLPYNDNSIVVTEPYRDWYIQSNNDELKNILSNNKIKFVEDVKFYENNKLKILNASHSALAYIGHLCGYTYVHEAIEDKNIYNFILNFLDQEVLPTLETKDDFNINEYKMKILERVKLDMRDALKKRKTDNLRVLRSLIARLKNQEISRAKTANNVKQADLLLKSNLDNIVILRDTLEVGKEEAIVRQKIRDLAKVIGEEEAKTQETRIRTNLQLERSLRMQVELAETIGQTFKDGFKEAITGANSFGEAMRNVLNRISDKLLDMAIESAFSGGLFKTILGGLGSIFSGGLGDVQGNFMPSNPTFRGAMATGGPVKGGSSYLVGEKGPEMFTPGVSGTITPNNALGGSVNVVVNVDASGSSVEGDEQQGRELGLLISSAVQSEIIQQQRPGGLLA